MTWTCDNCGELTHGMYGQCSSCGAYRSDTDDTDDEYDEYEYIEITGREILVDDGEDQHHITDAELSTNSTAGFQLKGTYRGTLPSPDDGTDGTPDPEEADRIAVDFDNTLTEDNVEYWTGERPDPDEEMVEWTNAQYNSGTTIIIWTARPWSEAGRVAAHCTEWGVKFHGIRCNKGSADCYVDDKAVHPSQISINQ